MTRVRSLPALLLPALFAGCSAAPASSPAAAIKARDWTQAAAAAAATAGPDGLAASLVAYLRVLSAGAAPDDIAGLIASHRDWPNQAALRAHYDASLLDDSDDVAVLALCRRLGPSSPQADLRCAEAAKAGGDAAGADWARAAWRDGGFRDPSAESAFLADWGPVLSGDDDWARFGRLSFPRGNSNAAAARAAARLSGVRKSIATARLALPSAPDPSATLAGVPAEGRSDPALVLLVARQLRRTGVNGDAMTFWRGQAMALEARQPASLASAFWAERDLLARALLADPGHDADAFAIADDTRNPSVTARGDALFLAGWIALRRLGQPMLAAADFEALGQLSPSITTRARAAYWLARADTDAGRQADAVRADAEAASFPTTFYGQRALASLSPDSGAFLTRLRTAIMTASTPAWTPAQALAFASGEMPRAAVLLVAWGQAAHAKAFLREADARAANPVDHALAAQLAVSLGLPDEAVAIARRSGRDGLALLPIGWPHPVTPPPALPAPLLLGLIRQESGFDPNATSPSGALGLMQLLPSTGGDVARAAHVAFAPARLTADPALNMRLGTAYLRMLLARFRGNVPASIAAYNAGPHRVAGWPPPPPSSADATRLDQPDAAMIDWIEAIPVAETRNYVQRVLENQAVYAALLETASG